MRPTQESGPLNILPVGLLMDALQDSTKLRHRGMLDLSHCIPHQNSAAAHPELYTKANKAWAIRRACHARIVGERMSVQLISHTQSRFEPCP